ncbi:hypothetical protein ACKAV7_011800 [Fusarium commune]
MTPNLPSVRKREEAKEDPDLNIEEEESAPYERNLWSRNRDMGDVQDDEPMEDTMAVTPRSAPAKTNGQSTGSLVASSSGSHAAESSARPRRSFRPPCRLVHDAPQSSIRRPEGPDEQTSASSAATTSQAFQSSIHPLEPPSSQITSPLPSASQNAQGAQRPGVEPFKQTASFVPDNPQTPVSLSATTPQGTMRPPQQPGSQGSATAAQNSVTGSLDWNAHLPTGDEFRESLKAASAALEPHIKSFEELLISINDERRRLTAVEQSLRLTKDEQAKDQEKAQDALKDVEKSITTENKMLRDLEDLYNKYPGDNELRTFLDKRKRTVLEHKKVYTEVKSQLDKSTAGLFKTDSKIALVTKRIGQLDAEKAEVIKGKIGIDTAAKRLMFMSRFMEPGRQARLAMVEEALGEEIMRSAF